jgi:pSer/pThr/pTyr-binding forkhead associated (FHA) protein
VTGIVLLGLRIALTAALYSFLGWTIWLLWRDLKHQEKISAFRQIPTLSLNVQIGEAARRQRFNSAEIIIGRDPNCACVIDSKTVSALHARLSYNQGQWWVEDLESTNGTLLNQTPVTEPTVLAPGDELSCGESVLTILNSDQPS